MKTFKLMTEEVLQEGPRTADTIAAALNKKGIRKSKMSEKDIISKISAEMKKMGMSRKEIEYSLSHDEDFIPDVLSGIKK